MQCKFIVYACPTGPLADQLDAYFAATRAACGPNTAHDYMPHCTLTGFFHDEAPAVPRYLAALEGALERARLPWPDPPIQVAEMQLRDDFHVLALESEWIKQVVADFAGRAHSPSRRDDIRLKDWLHLSLAYGFDPAQAPALAAYARALVDPTARAGWELRFYERLLDGGWRCHAQWSLTQAVV